ncbi:ABC transporter ATP-binding protein [Pelagibius marinus]|uniref:ABC transporter ATP-binding protein n=1 Tax=Pelagibius marinus TaxID=2762760 RepID=UPI00187316E7|nr:ABC transporter ATP-binding protein [Pelagibius marinus]
MLALTGLRRSFGGFTAVDDCSFTVSEGTITGLIGPNGAGKTTLFNLVAGLLRPEAGSVTFLGEDITALPPHARFRRGLLRTFQIPQEFHRLTVLENLMVAAAAQPGEEIWANWLAGRRVRAREAAVAARAGEVLDFLGLAPLAGTPAGRLSGGQKKLLELGRTMMSEARLVLLDEPAAGVNRTLLREIEDKIERLNRSLGLTFLIIEHDMETVARLCDPVICIAEGRVLVEGDFATVRSHPQVLDAYLGEAGL